MIMDPIKLRFYTEKYEKEKKNIKLVEEFVPIPRATSITRKFYAKHDTVTLTDIPSEYIKIVAKYAALTPKDVYTYRPPTVNMEYGWFSQPLIPRSSDPRLRFSGKQCDFIKNELKLRQLNKGVPIAKFTGIPFKA